MHLKLTEISESLFLRTILETWSPEGQKMLRRVTDNACALTVAADRPGWYLVETAAGLRFLPVIALVEGLYLTNDGRGFPQGRAHYVLATVQLTYSREGKGKNQDGPAADQTR